MTRLAAVRRLKRAQKYLAKTYCVARGVGWGRWSRWEAKAAYALLSHTIKEMCRPAALALVILLFAFAGEAQTVPYLKAGVTVGSLGYRNPGFEFGGGVDHRARRFTLLAEGMLSTADKLDTRTGTAVKGSAGFYAAAKRSFSLGGGGRCTRLWTSAYAKGSCRPFAGVIYEREPVQFRADYIFSGTDAINHLRGLRTATVIRFGHHVDFEYEFGFYRFTPSFGTRLLSGIQSNVFIRFHRAQLKTRREK